MSVEIELLLESVVVHRTVFSEVYDVGVREDLCELIERVDEALPLFIKAWSFRKSDKEERRIGAYFSIAGDYSAVVTEDGVLVVSPIGGVYIVG